MPVSRFSQRRRSSVALGANLRDIKPGNYGITTSPRNVTFAPNVTPGTYVEDVEGDDAPADVPSPADALFPPTEITAPAPTRRRAPPGKRRSQGYIPRPPNAFMLFRANFVRQKHVPGSIETNHGSLSKIIGNCWRALPEPEKKIWEARAKKAKQEHREMYPNYRFRPVHNKNKKRKEKMQMELPDEQRCEEVAQLLLEGKKGDELAAALRLRDTERARSTASASPMPQQGGMYPMMPAPMYPMRRSSSVPPTLYAPIAIPLMPFFPLQAGPSMSRPESPVGNIARSNRFVPRRPSSAGPSYYGGWAMPPPSGFSRDQLQPDEEPLPEVNTGLFETSFLDSSEAFSMAAPHVAKDELFAPCDPSAHPTLALDMPQFDGGVMGPSTSSTTASSAYPFSATTPADHFDPMAWHQPFDETPASASPTEFSATPEPDDHTGGQVMYAPQPELQPQYQTWMNNVAVANAEASHEMMSFAQATEFSDAHLHMQDYNYGVAQFDNVTQCAMESEAFFVHDYPVEVSQY